MRLSRHPAAPADPVRSIEASARREGAALRIDWQLAGDIDLLRLPAPAPPVRADGLWHHTCFEAFLRGAQRRDYVELNFAPSGAWAAYRFDDCRTGMAELPLDEAPRAEWCRTQDGLALAVTFAGAPAGALGIALAAVIESQSGTITHWALRHPAAAPDFHHPQAFALGLPGTTRGGDRA
jgi:hypothetical protein